jgi:AraC-like DNA-binding protein
MDQVCVNLEYLKMKPFKLTLTPSEPGAAFQIHRLGFHERMKACMVDRPDGTKDFLFMLFHSEVRVRTSEGEALWSTPGLMVWAPPDGHYYGNDQKSWSHSWFHCSGCEISPILTSCGIPLRKRIPISEASMMDAFLAEMTRELQCWKPDAKILHNLFENFVRRVARHAFKKAELAIPARLLGVRAYVEQHFTEPLRLEDLARRAGWSIPHFCTEFRRYFGIPVIQFVLQLRMSQATYLLRDRDRRIGEIAEALGYPDQYAFSKMFKRSLGISPRKFRESLPPGLNRKAAKNRKGGVGEK